MSFKPFTKIRVATENDVNAKNINAMQDNIAKALSQVLGKDQLDLSLLNNVTLYPGIINMISHGLGRKLQGWIPVGNHGGYCLLTDMQDTNPSPELLLYLTTPVYVVVNFLVF